MVCVCVVGKPNLVKCFGPRLRLWTWTLDFVPGPSFSIFKTEEVGEHSKVLIFYFFAPNTSKELLKLTMTSEYRAFLELKQCHIICFRSLKNSSKGRFLKIMEFSIFLADPPSKEGKLR